MFNKKSPNFLLGLMTGIAIIATVGFLIMTAAYFQKSKELSTSGSRNTNTGDTDNQAQKAPGEKVDIKVSATDNMRGDKNAPVTIVEFSDFQCPYCSRFHETMNRVMEDYDGKVRWVFRHFPLENIHPLAKKAALAAECAGEQEKFWEYADSLYDNQLKLADSYFGELAATLGLDKSKFNSCYQSQKYLDKVNNDIKQGKSLGVSGTPASYINGTPAIGAYPYEEIKKIIDENLK